MGTSISSTGRGRWAKVRCRPPSPPHQFTSSIRMDVSFHHREASLIEVLKALDLPQNSASSSGTTSPSPSTMQQGVYPFNHLCMIAQGLGIFIHIFYIQYRKQVWEKTEKKNIVFSVYVLFKFFCQDLQIFLFFFFSFFLKEIFLFSFILKKNIMVYVGKIQSQILIKISQYGTNYIYIYI